MAGAQGPERVSSSGAAPPLAAYSEHLRNPCESRERLLQVRTQKSAGLLEGGSCGCERRAVAAGGGGAPAHQATRGRPRLHGAPVAPRGRPQQGQVLWAALVSGRARGTRHGSRSPRGSECSGRLSAGNCERPGSCGWAGGSGGAAPGDAAPAPPASLKLGVGSSVRHRGRKPGTGAGGGGVQAETRETGRFL